MVVGSINSTDFKKLDFISKPDYKLKVETRLLGGTYATISNAIMQSVPYAQAADNGVPVGTMLIFAGPKANIPSGWLPCDGSSVGETSYPKLFSVIGTSWGGGSGNFNLPDMRGLFPRGVDEGNSRDPDAGSRTAITTGGNTGASTDRVGSYQSHGYQSHGHSASSGNESAHRHSYWDIFHSENGGAFTGTKTTVPNNSGSGDTDNDNEGWNMSRNSEPGSAHNHSVTVNASGGSETRPKNVGVWYIIRAR